MIKRKQQFFFFLSLLIIFFLFFSCKKEQPLEVNYTITNVNESINIQRISFLNDTVGYVCGGIRGQSGYIFKTNDAGSSWQKIFYNAAYCLYDIVFYNDSIGFSCGENSLLLKTTNGGLTWVNEQDMQQPYAVGYDGTLRKIFCFDDKMVYAVGGSGFEIGLAYITYNAGNHWFCTTVDHEVRDVYYTAPLSGIYCGYGTIFKTTDGANTFTPMPVDNDFFVSMNFITNSIGFACGYNGGIYKTVDGGNSWESQLGHNNDIVHTRHFNQIKFINSNEGYAVGNNGLISYTIDGGEHWKEIKKITDANLFSVWIKNKNEIFISSTNGTIFKLAPR